MQRTEAELLYMALDQAFPNARSNQVVDTGDKAKPWDPYWERLESAESTVRIPKGQEHMSKPVWSLMYVAGNPAMFTKVTANASNPLSRAEAIEGAEKLAKSGWRVWVEHHQTAKRIFESEAEVAAQEAANARRIIDFAEVNLPGSLRH
jgi:hypothetical protein